MILLYASHEASSPTGKLFHTVNAERNSKRNNERNYNLQITTELVNNSTPLVRLLSNIRIFLPIFFTNRKYCKVRNITFLQFNNLNINKLHKTL